MRVLIGADHAGFELKQELQRRLSMAGYEIIDKGTHSTDPVDYPDVAKTVADAINAGEAPRAILICGSGVGASVAANKVRGIRAGLCHDHYSAHQGVEHDDVNVLVLGARVIGVEVANEAARAFLAAVFSNEERHRRRVAKINALDNRGERS